MVSLSEDPMVRLLRSLGGFGAIHPIYSFFLGAIISVFFSTDHDQINTKIKDTHHFYGIGINIICYKSTRELQFPMYGEYLTKRVRERMLSKILTFEVGWFDKEENSSGAVCSRLTTEANVVSI